MHGRIPVAAVLCIIAALLSVPCFAGQAVLSWDSPTTNADGTPLTDLAGFKVYYGTVSRGYTSVSDVGKVTSATITNLQPLVTYYFSVTAYDGSGNESAYSNEVSKKIPSGAACSYSVSANVDFQGSAAHTGRVQVTAGNGCSWTARSQTPWLTVVSGGAGSGNGAVTYSVSQNTSGQPRVGLLNVAGADMIVFQANAEVRDLSASALWSSPYVYVLYMNGVIGPFTGGYFSPQRPVTRGEMAQWAIRGLFGDSFVSSLYPYFADVPAMNPHFRYIQEARELGFTAGCNPPLNNLYCPDADVTRQSGAAFVVRALFGESFAYTAAPYFRDVPQTSSLFKYIQKMRDEGITTGCNPPQNDRFCPTETLTRAAMAAMLARGLYGLP